MSRSDAGQNAVLEECIIAVMGPTGVGKSTFINRATRQDSGTIGHKLKSCTTEIQAVQTYHPKTKHPIVFVDTPGFDDTFKSDTEILALIEAWLVQVYKQRNKIGGILYLHRITDNRMSSSILNNFHVIKDVFGHAAHKITLVTTMWDDINEERGLQREEELKKDYWHEAMADGAATARFLGTFDSAWSIVGRFFDEAGPVSPTTTIEPVQIQREIVLDRRTLKETEAGQWLSKEFVKALKEQEEADRRLQRLLERSDDGQQAGESRPNGVSGDRVIVLMGPTGAGRSTFIDCATRGNGAAIGNNLKSFTSEIRAIRCSSPNTGDTVVFVDTPGFDDTFKSETEILALITEWLIKAYKQQIKICGILYLHRITDNRMNNPTLKHFHVFGNVFGKAAHKNITFVTTMWDCIKEETGCNREKELTAEYWHEAIAAGATTARFVGTYESAWSIVNPFFSEANLLSLIGSMPAGDRLRDIETEAAWNLSGECDESFRVRQNVMHGLQEPARDRDNRFVTEQTTAHELEKKIVEAKHQIDDTRNRLTQGLARFARLIFKKR